MRELGRSIVDSDWFMDISCVDIPFTSDWPLMGSSPDSSGIQVVFTRCRWLAVAAPLSTSPKTQLGIALSIPRQCSGCRCLNNKSSLSLWLSWIAGNLLFSSSVIVSIASGTSLNVALDKPAHSVLAANQGGEICTCSVTK